MKATRKSPVLVPVGWEQVTEEVPVPSVPAVRTVIAIRPHLLFEREDRGNLDCTTATRDVGYRSEGFSPVYLAAGCADHRIAIDCDSRAAREREGLRVAGVVVSGRARVASDEVPSGRGDRVGQRDVT